MAYGLLWAVIDLIVRCGLSKSLQQRALPTDIQPDLYTVPTCAAWISAARGWAHKAGAGGAVYPPVVLDSFLQMCSIHDTSIFNIPGYHMIHHGKKCSQHSGLVINLSDEFSFTIKDIEIDSDLWDGQFVEVNGGNLNGKLTLGNIYRPPRFDNSNTTLKTFLTELDPIISCITKDKADVLITGDFNINLLQINERTEIQKYFDLFVTRGLFPRVTLPTRMATKNASLIDQLFCKVKNPSQHIISCIIKTDISDHFPYFSVLDLLKKKNHQPKNVQINNNDENSFRMFYNDVSHKFDQISWTRDLFNDPNDNYDIFEKTILDAKSNYLAPKSVRFKKYKHKINPWITQGILNSIRYRDKLYRKFIKTDPNSHTYLSMQLNLRTYKCLLKKAIRNAKIEYCATQFNNSKSNIRHTWSVVKEILNKCKNKRDFPEHFTVNGTNISNAVDISNHFNDFFANVGNKLVKIIKPQKGENIDSYLKQNIISSFNFECIDVSTVQKIIKDLASKNSCGHDSISSKFLKRIEELVVKPLSLIINQPLCTGIFPKKLKIAKVIPLFKKGDSHLFDNYRPISLLPAISKIFEKVVFQQTYEYFNKHNLLHTSQYGFRKKHSTELAALELTDQVTNYLDSGKLPISIFLDLSKAFDTLDHSILLHKLKYYGVDTVPLNWFKSYFEDRFQFVDYDGTKSNITSITTGVPQGSILGPLLFIIYINDIHEATDNFKAISYADDTNLTSPLCYFSPSLTLNNISIQQISDNINTELNDIFVWLCVNKLALNVKKTKYMLFHYRQRDIGNLIPSLKINDEPVERVTEFDFLGLTIDETLSWQKISNKISRTLGIMGRLKKFLPINILILMYNSLVLPHLQFGLLTWGFKMGRLDKLQKRAVRIITCQKYNAHTEPLFKKLSLLKLNDLFRLNVLKLYYKFNNGLLPIYVASLFRYDTGNEHYDLRNENILINPEARTRRGENCIRCYLPRLVNNTNQDILKKTSTHSYQGFAFYIKRNVISNYATSCTIANCYICSRRS